MSKQQVHVPHILFGFGFQPLPPHVHLLFHFLQGVMGEANVVAATCSLPCSFEVGSDMAGHKEDTESVWRGSRKSTTACVAKLLGWEVWHSSALCLVHQSR